MNWDDFFFFSFEDLEVAPMYLGTKLSSKRTVLRYVDVRNNSVCRSSHSTQRGKMAERSLLRIRRLAFDSRVPGSIPTQRCTLPSSLVCKKLDCTSSPLEEVEKRVGSVAITSSYAC